MLVFLLLFIVLFALVGIRNEKTAVVSTEKCQFK